ITVTIVIAVIIIAVILMRQFKSYKQARLDRQAPTTQRDLELLKTEDVIGFRLSGALFQQISDWEYIFDEMVFKEQLAIGSFRGQFPVDESSLAVMRKAKEEGRILPYYG